MALKPADGRLALYLLVPVAGALLATVPGVQWDPSRGLLTVHLETALNAIWGYGGGALAALGIYARWAKR